MAENNVGTQAKLEAHSLQHYNETGVINTMYAFRDGILRFTDLSDKIVEVERRLCSYWDGIAHQEFHERFQRVFCQVRNLGSALGDIYDMLNEAQLTFYETDDGFDQQLREAIHNTAKGGSESSGTDKALRDVTPRVMPDVYTPNLTYTPLPAKPVLVSTIGAAFVPDLNYVAMSARTVQASCMPSAVTILLSYQSLAVKETISHQVVDALTELLEHVQMELREAVESVMPDAIRADGTAYTPASYKDGTNTVLGAAVVGVVTDALVKGTPRDECITNIGEAIISRLEEGTYPASRRSELVHSIGEAVYNELYGTGTPGDLTAGAGLRSIGSMTEWSTNLRSQVDRVVLESWKDVTVNGSNNEDTGALTDKAFIDQLRRIWGKEVVPGLYIMNQPLPLPQTNLTAAEATQVAAQVADHSNAQAMQRIIAASITENTGRTLNSNLVLDVQLTASSDSGYQLNLTATDICMNLNDMVQLDPAGVTVNPGAVQQTMAQLCSQPISGDFSSIQYPVIVS